MNATLSELHGIVGDDGWIADPARMAPFLEEPRGRFHGRPAAVICPVDTAQVARVLAVCNAARLGVVPQGGNTGLCGGAMPDSRAAQVVLNLRRMKRIRALDAANFTITAEAGCILADVQAAAARADRLFPLSLAAEGSCQIGGNLATNAGGTNALRYGVMRNLALGLEVVLADGEVLDGLVALKKDNTGYDLRDLFIGSEGTLGVITAAVLRLFPQPRDVQTAVVAVASPAAAVRLLAHLEAASDNRVSACELMSARCVEFAVRHIPGCRDPIGSPAAWQVLVEISGGQHDGELRPLLEAALSEALRTGTIADAALAGSRAQASAFWRLRESISEAQKSEGASIKHDVSVPLSRIADFIGEATIAVEAALPGARVCAFGHLGDGNIHFNVSQPPGAEKAAFLGEWERCNRIVHDLAVAARGSFSAEHGIGQLKRGELARYKPPVALRLMRDIKRVLDPNCILNPGKVIPD